MGLLVARLAPPEADPSRAAENQRGGRLARSVIRRDPKRARARVQRARQPANDGARRRVHALGRNRSMDESTRSFWGRWLSVLKSWRSVSTHWSALLSIG